MSYILDALRKSEQERLRGQPLSTLGHAPIAPGAPERPRWLMPLLAGNLALLTVLAVWWLRGMVDAAPAAGDAAPVPAASTAARATPSVAAARLPAPAAAPPPPAYEAPPERTQQEAFEPLPDANRDAPSDANAPDVANEAYESAGDWQSARGDLPPLVLSTHVYSGTPSARNVIINGVRLREGERLDNGVQVVEITETGARVRYHGSEHELDIR